jgi:glycine cleavage system H protein
MAKARLMRLPEDRYYAAGEHLWVKVEGGRARLGMDELGCWAAGSIAHVELHHPGKRLARVGAAFGTLEANKFVGALRTPLRGTIQEVNRDLLKNPRLLNTDPYGEGWLAVLEPSHLTEDLAPLVHGRAAIIHYAREKTAEYRRRGILPEEADDIQVVVR